MIDPTTLPVPPQTPALVIDRVALNANLAAMQARCDAAGVRLRPHGKMHKCSTFGLLQVERGAVGLCCQTVGEAEAFARAGISDLLVSAPVPPWGAARIAEITRTRGCHLAVVCDSTAQIDRLGAAAVAAKVTISALVDVNIGMHRAGCTVDEAPLMAARITATPGLNYGGVQAYFGNLQHLATGRAEANAAASATLRTLVAELADQGLAPPVVTGGGTGTFQFDLEAGIFTELQCGSYALMDVEYLDCGGPGADWPFAPALFIAASVVSAKHKGHVTVDVGLKASSADMSPRVVGGAAPGSLWRSMGDEHGAIVHPAFFAALSSGTDSAAIDADPALSWQPDAPGEGDIVWMLPGHVDPTINLYDAFYVTREDGALDRWPIDARRVSS